MLLLTDFCDAPPFHLHAPYQQATGDYGSWDARRAFSGVTKQVMQAHDAGRRGAGDAARDQACAGRAAGSGGGAVQPWTRWPARSTPDSQPVLYPTRYYLPPPPPPADAARVAAAAEALLAARTPGDRSPATACASRRATSSCVALAEAAGLPVATTAAGKGCFAETHPLALGVFGTFGTAAANACVGEADLVLVVGSKLGAERYRVGEPRSARPDAADLYPDRHRAAQRVVDTSRPSTCCSATPRRSCGQLLRGGRSRMRPDAARPARRGSPAAREQHGYFNAPAYFADDTPILPQRVIGELMRNLPDDAIVTCDAGENRILMTHFYQTKQAGGFLQAAGSGPMGFAIPAALAAKLVHPDRPVVAVCGDGGFAMTMNGLMTAHRAGHPDHRRRVQQQRARLGVARLRAVRRRVQRFRPRRDRPRDGLPRRAGRRTRRRSGPALQRGARRARADGDRRAHLAGRRRSPTSPRRWPTRRRRGGGRARRGALALMGIAAPVIASSTPAFPADPP